MTGERGALLMLCLEYLHRHPRECHGVSADMVADLAAYHHAKHSED